ncbi:venom protease-like [Palaemon carinicauda]|uniref:venom protease-like n=1 Tax=Palaemon carinicauda TaxID=392227 RepID=UPI0035B607C0
MSNNRKSSTWRHWMVAIASICIAIPVGLSQDLQFGNGYRPGTRRCVPREGGPGECRLLFSCPPVVKTFGRIRPAVCGFHGKVPIVCCPKSRESKKQPEIPPKMKIPLPPPPDIISFACGRCNGNTTRPMRSDVVGGKEASPNSWPWMAVLGRYDGRDVTWICDGTLISPWFVLTAAHCLDFSQLDVVRLGDHNLQERDVTPLDLGIAMKVFHPEYHPPAATHDLALLRLSSRVTFTEKISPICLPWVEKEAPNLEGRKLTVTGWGATSFGGSMSNVLREVIVTVFPNRDCDTSYSTLRDYTFRFPGKICGAEFICAGDKDGGKDACKGDSGGPLMYNFFGRYVLGGVVSAGQGCGYSKFPGIYSAVAPALQWIRDVAFVETSF